MHELRPAPERGAIHGQHVIEIGDEVQPDFDFFGFAGVLFAGEFYARLDFAEGYGGQEKLLERGTCGGQQASPLFDGHHNSRFDTAAGGYLRPLAHARIQKLAKTGLGVLDCPVRRRRLQDNDWIADQPIPAVRAGQGPDVRVWFSGEQNGTSIPLRSFPLARSMRDTAAHASKRGRRDQAARNSSRAWFGSPWRSCWELFTPLERQDRLRHDVQPNTCSFLALG